MPDGSQAAPLLVPKAPEASLADALDRLLACAERGLHPDEVLRDIRALLRERGLLLGTGPDAHAGPAPDPSGPRATSDTLGAAARG